jgi:predicted O-linked N-acetylglucosamine transferase (SPINDLY family)
MMRQVPNATDLKLQQAIAFHQRGMLSDATRLYEDILKQRPKHFDALHLLGVIACQTRNFGLGEELIARAISVDRNHAVAYLNRGNALKELRRLDEALGCFNKAITLKPDLVDAHSGRSIVLYHLKRLDEALAGYDRTIALKPDHTEAYNNRGIVLFELGRLDEALVDYGKAIALKPNYAEAYGNRGASLFDLGRLDEALANCEKAVALKPDHAQAHSNCGRTLYLLKRLHEALASFDKAVALKPDLTEAWFGRSNVLYDLGRLDEALANCEKALAFDPDVFSAEGIRLHIKMNLCDWTNFDVDCENMVLSVRKGKSTGSPFGFLGVAASEDDQLECARLWAAKVCRAPQRALWQGEPYRHDRIRVAYVSADFREHPVSQLMVGVLQQHERSLFDITAISLGPDDNSEIRRRLTNSVEHFVDARSFNDDQVASLVRSSEVDILVDLMGFTAGSRTGVFARRPAPVQVNYLGFAGTMGTPHIDYILADRFVIPEAKRASYSEKVVYLPNSYMPTDSQLKISDRSPRRLEHGLPETGFVFCSFNNAYKITPEIFGVWMRLLRAIDGSALWLSETNETATRNLRHRAQSLGIDPARLIFAPKVPLKEDHLARHGSADLFLDTLPYNAHTTAVDALWAGLPLLTRTGETFAGRVATSLLNAVGLAELVTTTSEIYERTAIDLAKNPAKLEAIKQKLADRRVSAPLFNTELFTKHIEAAYTAIYQRHHCGLAPDHLLLPN